MAKIAVADNQTVKIGDILVRIDDRDFKSRVELEVFSSILLGKSKLVLKNNETYI